MVAKCEWQTFHVSSKLRFPLFLTFVVSEQCKMPLLNHPRLLLRNEKNVGKHVFMRGNQMQNSRQMLNLRRFIANLPVARNR